MIPRIAKSSGLLNVDGNGMVTGCIFNDAGPSFLQSIDSPMTELSFHPSTAASIHDQSSKPDEDLGRNNA